MSVFVKLMTGTGAGEPSMSKVQVNSARAMTSELYDPGCERRNRFEVAGDVQRVC